MQNIITHLRKTRKKIAFTGTHGVGKSTILNNLANNSWCEVLNEVFRDTAEMFGILCNGDTKKQSCDTTLHCFYRQMMREIELEKTSYKHIICDRTPFDCFLYNEVGNKFQRINYKAYNDCRKIAINHLKTYDVIYFVKYEEFPIENDGFRNIDIENQKMVNEYMMKEFQSFANVQFISYKEGMELQGLKKVEF